MSRSFHPLILLCAGGLASLPAAAHDRENQPLAAHPADPAGAGVTLQSGWDSRYLSEGRDNLDGDALWRSSLDWERGPLALGTWYGASPEQDYDELQLSIALRQSFGDVDTYVGYTHLRFPFERTHDDELGTGLVFGGGPLGIEWAADLTYAFDAAGWFAELAASRGWDLGERLSAELSAVFGVNQGYVADGHDGANHGALNLAIRYALSDTVAVTIHGTQSWAIGRQRSAPGDALLMDFFHAGVGLEWSF